jgi:hypothetical protein
MDSRAGPFDAADGSAGGVVVDGSFGGAAAGSGAGVTVSDGAGATDSMAGAAVDSAGGTGLAQAASSTANNVAPAIIRIVIWSSRFAMMRPQLIVTVRI